MSDTKHAVAFKETNRIVCTCGTVCDAKIGKAAAHIMGSRSDYFVAVKASTIFARHLRAANTGAAS